MRNIIHSQNCPCFIFTVVTIIYLISLLYIFVELYLQTYSNSKFLNFLNFLVKFMSASALYMHHKAVKQYELRVFGKCCKYIAKQCNKAYDESQYDDYNYCCCNRDTV